MLGVLNKMSEIRKIMTRKKRFSWVSKITRNEQNLLQFIIEDVDGSKYRASPATLQESLPISSDIEGRIEIDLAGLRRVDTSEYLNDINLNHLSPKAQSTYMWESATETLIIPAQILILSVFGSYFDFRIKLFEPISPTRLQTSLRSVTLKKIIQELDGDLQKFKGQARLVTRLSWMINFPSATRSWSSVYRNALVGKLDMSLPFAKAFARYKGKNVNGRIIISELKISSVIPYEMPISNSSNPNDIEILLSMHGENINRTARPVNGDSRLIRFRNKTTLTDAEWESIEPILGRQFLTSSSIRIHPLPTLVGLILYKFATPCLWSNVPAKQNIVESARNLHRKLINSGAWAEIVQKLSGSQIFVD